MQHERTDARVGEKAKTRLFRIAPLFARCLQQRVRFAWIHFADDTTPRTVSIGKNSRKNNEISRIFSTTSLHSSDFDKEKDRKTKIAFEG